MLKTKVQGAGGQGGGGIDPDLVIVVDTSIQAFTQLPFTYSTSIDVDIDWGDGSPVENFTTAGGTASHTYASTDIFTIRVSGSTDAFGGNTRNNYIKCLSFGNLGIQRLYAGFYQCANLTEVPDYLPDTVTDLDTCFRGCTSFNYDISSWDVSNVTTFRNLFYDASAFNQNIGSWDTSSVNTFSGVFYGATVFNQNIGSWDTSSVTTFNNMFYGATAFNQDIGGWKTPSATNMDNMFRDATNFNQDLTDWCVGFTTTEPSNFSTNSALTTGNKPVWGTCPAYTTVGSITFIGAATGVTSATLPAHQAGDLIIGYAYRDGNTVPPSMPAGWTSIRNSGGNSNSCRVAYIIAADSSTTSGTWSNATDVLFLVYRGDYTTIGILDYDVTTNGSGTTVTYPATSGWDNLSMVLAFGGHRSTNTNLQTPPSGLTLRSNRVGTGEIAAFDSDGTYGDWPSTNVSVGGTGSGWITVVLRLRYELIPV